MEHRPVLVPGPGRPTLLPGAPTRVLYKKGATGRLVVCLALTAGVCQGPFCFEDVPCPRATCIQSPEPRELGSGL